MGYYDDDDKYDDDLSYDDDYNDLEDEDSEDSKDTSPPSRVNPYSGGGLPGRDRAGGLSSGTPGSRTPPSSDSRDDIASRLRNSTSGGSSSGGGSYNRPAGSGSGTGSGSNTPGTGGDRPRPSPFSTSGSGGSGSNSPRPFSSGSSGSGSPGSSGSGGSGANAPRTFGGGSAGGGSSSGSSSGSSGSGSSAFGNRSGLGTSGGAKPEEKKEPPRSDDKSNPSGGNRFGGFGSRVGGDKPVEQKKPEEKKDDKSAGNTGGGIGNRFGGIASGLTSRVGGDKPADDKKPQEKKDDKSAGNTSGGIGSRFSGIASGLTSRVSGGDKPADDKKPDGGTSGGIGSRFGGIASGLTSRVGGGDKPADDKKPDDKSASGGVTSRLSGLAGGLTSRFGGGGDKPAETSGNRPAAPFGNRPASPTSTTSTPASSASSTGPRFGSAFPGQTSTPGGSRPAAAPAKPQEAAKAASTSTTAPQGFFASLTRRLPIGFGNTDDKKAAKSASSKTRANKVPQAAAEGMSLDTKLDILGVVLVFVSLVLFLSSLSSEQGRLTAGINQFFSQWLGLGALAVPIVMMAAGIWLVLRHFGEEAPKLDLIRITGIALFYVMLLITFQYIESFDPVYGGSFETYQLLSPKTIEFGRGGGQIGWTMYNFLVQNATELGGAVVAIGMLVISIMLMSRTSAAELAVIVVSIYRSFQVSLQRRAQRRAAAQLAAQQASPIALPQISVAKPALAELPGGSTAALPPPIPAMLPEIEQPIAVSLEDRPITIRMGGQTLTSGEPATPMTRMPSPTISKPTPPPAALPAASKAEDDGAGIGSRLRQAVPGGLSWGGNKSDDSRNAETEKKEEGGGLRGMFGRRPAAETPAVPKPTIPAKLDGNPSAGGLARSANPFAPANPFARSGEVKPEAAPAAASAVPAATNTPPPPEEFFKPATPKGIIPAAQTPSPVDSGTAGENPQVVMPTGEDKPTVTAPAAETPTPSSAASATLGTPADGGGTLPNRVDRLNELRQGVLSSQPKPAASSDEQKPAASVESPSVSPTPGAPLRPRPFASTATPTPAAGFGRPAASDKPVDAEKVPPAASIGPAVTEAPKITLPAAPTAVPGQPTPQPQPPASQRVRKNYALPEYRTLLSPGSEQDFDRESLVKKARMIEDTLQSFGAPGRVVEINTGPVITQFGVEPGYLNSRGGNKSRVKVSAIAQLDKDLQLALGARSIRVEAPVPGKGYVGIEVPNDQPATVSLRDVMEAKEFQRIKSPLAIGLGQSVDGTPISADLTSMPHLLIAGTTGSGKSVCVNSIIASLLLRNSPEKVKFIMVDPKRVELTGYNGIPHLVAPVVVELERIVGVLKWVTREMDERYKKFSNAGARNIEDYNKHLNPSEEPLPYIVVIIDELADLMMLAPEETERTITRIAALARATGIHLVIATQRPSVDVVTGLIKANFPARIAFAVAGSVDSRVILDQPGAERLLGRGDMLYMSGDAPSPLRLQGVYVSDNEINNIVRYWRSQQADDAPQRPISALVMDDSPAENARSVATAPRTFGTLQTNSAAPAQQRGQAFWEEDEDDEDDHLSDKDSGGDDSEDELYEESVEMVRRLGKASVSLLQRRLRIGYTRAARLIDLMEERGVVGPATEGSKPREVLK